MKQIDLKKSTLRSESVDFDSNLIEAGCEILCFQLLAQNDQPQQNSGSNFFKLFNENYDNFGDWNMLSWEQMLQHLWNWRIWDPPNLIGSLFVLLICIDKNTQVFNFTYSHFWPTPFPFLTNALSLTSLIGCTVSLSLSLSSDSPQCFNLCQFR